jgi:S-formylglutathione hydrolase FrmB
VLPAGYGTSGTRYPVLWLLHGYGGGKDDWLKRTDLVRQVERYPFIVVLPAAENSWYVNSPSDPTAQYQDFITIDLYNDVLQRFAVDTLRQAIAGLSMGGYGAVMLGLRHPERYAFVGGLSAALSVASSLGAADSVLWKGTGKSIIAAFGARDMSAMSAYDPLRLFRNTRPDTLPYIFLAIGTSDGFSSFVPANRAFTDSLRAYGAPYEYHEIPGTHSWLVWQSELGPMLGSAWKVLESRKPRVP